MHPMNSQKTTEIKSTRSNINRAIRQTGLTLEGVPGDGVFYFIDSEGWQVGESVYVAYMNQLTVSRWIIEAESAKAEGRI